MRTLHEVSSCRTCPMAVDGYCCHPSNPRYGGADDTDDRRYESEVHELCPLRKSELLIVIEGWRR